MITCTAQRQLVRPCVKHEHWCSTGAGTVATTCAPPDSRHHHRLETRFLDLETRCDAPQHVLATSICVASQLEAKCLSTILLVLFWSACPIIFFFHQSLADHWLVLSLFGLTIRRAGKLRLRHVRPLHSRLSVAGMAGRIVHRNASMSRDAHRSTSLAITNRVAHTAHSSLQRSAPQGRNSNCCCTDASTDKDSVLETKRSIIDCVSGIVEGNTLECNPTFGMWLHAACTSPPVTDCPTTPDFTGTDV
jgi:hypothetical protein